jgi:hypothetical protein
MAHLVSRCCSDINVQVLSHRAFVVDWWQQNQLPATHLKTVLSEKKLTVQQEKK